MSQFQKIQKLQNFIHFNKQGISCLEILLVSNFGLLQNAVKGWNSLCHWPSNIWAAELGKYYGNVYGRAREIDKCQSVHQFSKSSAISGRTYGNSQLEVHV